MTLAVNVSPRQFHLTDLAGCASAALAASGFPARLLELEITESALAERVDEVRQVLVRLRELGLRIAVDDFGTGYSSLAQLKRFPIDVLKIDQGFIRDIPHSADDMAISTAIIGMGHSLGMSYWRKVWRPRSRWLFCASAAAMPTRATCAVGHCPPMRLRRC